MDKRHSDTLDSKLEQIITEGAVYISWNELYLWYEAKALAASTYRDLHARWADITKRHKKKHGESLGYLCRTKESEKLNTGIFLFASERFKALENPDS